MEGFESGAAELDDWLIRYGWTNHAAGNARVFVATRGRRVVGYYALSAASVDREKAPAALLRGGPPVEIPCLLLGRLAVDHDEQGRRLGRSLLIDVLRRVLRISSEIGVQALLVHARDAQAKAWYLDQLPSLQQSPVDDMQLVLPIKALRRAAEPGPT